MPATYPLAVGQKQGVFGGPGGCAQHQKVGVKQIVPGRWGGTCARTTRAEPTKNKTANVTRNLDMRGHSAVHLGIISCFCRL